VFTERRDALVSTLRIQKLTCLNWGPRIGYGDSVCSVLSTGVGIVA
jgi:hypothetical protein